MPVLSTPGHPARQVATQKSLRRRPSTPRKGAARVRTYPVCPDMAAILQACHRARVAHGLSQRAIALILRVDVATVTKLETGFHSPTGTRLAAYARACGLVLTVQVPA